MKKQSLGMCGLLPIAQMPSFMKMIVLLPSVKLKCPPAMFLNVLLSNDSDLVKM